MVIYSLEVFGKKSYCERKLKYLLLVAFSAMLFNFILFILLSSDDEDRIEMLLENFVAQGPTITDPGASQALALALAKLSQEPTYMTVMGKLNLFSSVLELLIVLIDLHKGSLLLQESCCIAICRISLKLDFVPVADKERIAKVFLDMLQTDDKFVLSNTISGIRALGASGLCPKELLSETLLPRVAEITARYQREVELCRTGCAVLAVFSYYAEAHPMLAEEKIMRVLLDNIRTEDNITREMVATTLCNISVSPSSSMIMIRMGVVEMLAALSNSTSEIILELCAKCICNLSCNVDLHRKMIDHKVLDIILMIALVRSVSNSTKIICARAMLNMVSDENLQFIKDAGAVRVFASLSSTHNLPIQNVCARGYFLFTLNTKRRMELVQRRPILQALYNMVKCSSSRIKIKVGTSVCNLLSCPESCIPAIKAGALSVIKIIATMDFEELREATARVIINLAQDVSLHHILLKEPIVPILVLILQQSTDYTFECAIFALSCLSQSVTFKPLLIEKDCISALIGTIIGGKVCVPVIAEEVSRCIAHLTYCYEKAETIIASGNLLLALQAIYLSGICSYDCALLIVLILRNISEFAPARKYIIEQDGFKLLVAIVNDFTYGCYDCSLLYSAIISCMYNLSLVSTTRDILVKQGIIVLLKRICLYSRKSEILATPTSLLGTESVTQQNLLRVKPIDKSIVKPYINNNASLADDELPRLTLKFTGTEIDRISRTINLLTESPSSHENIVNEGIIEIFKTLIHGLSEASKNEIASSLASLASSKQCRKALVNQGTTELLIALSVTSNASTKAHCALALGYVSELTKVDNGVVASLLLLALRIEEVNSKDVASHLQSGMITSHKDGVMPQTSSVADPIEMIRKLKIDVEPKLAGSSGAPANASLFNMIRDLMNDKWKFDNFIESLEQRNNNNLNRNNFVYRASSPDSKTIGEVPRLLIDEGHEALLLEQERLTLLCNYARYKYDAADTSERVYEPEIGGMSGKLLVELPLPGIPQKRDLEPSDRHEELAKIPVSQEPLPKELKNPTLLDSTRPNTENQAHINLAADTLTTIGSADAADLLKGNGGDSPDNLGVRFTNADDNSSVGSAASKSNLPRTKTIPGMLRKQKSEKAIGGTTSLPGGAWNKK